MALLFCAMGRQDHVACAVLDFLRPHHHVALPRGVLVVAADSGSEDFFKALPVVHFLDVFLQAFV
ncbi:hypothetical protein D3C76_1599570 [compost metagenome]